MFNVRILFRVQNYGEKSVIIPISVVFLVEDSPESLREDPRPLRGRPSPGGCFKI